MLRIGAILAGPYHTEVLCCSNVAVRRVCHHRIPVLVTIAGSPSLSRRSFGGSPTTHSGREPGQPRLEEISDQSVDNCFVIYKKIPPHEVKPGDLVQYLQILSVAEVFPRHDGSSTFVMFLGGLMALFTEPLSVVDESKQPPTGPVLLRTNGTPVSIFAMVSRR